MPNVSNFEEHQGGIIGTDSATVALLPPHRDSLGGGAADTELPADAVTARTRMVEGDSLLCQRDWVKQIIDRDGSPRELLIAAVERAIADPTHDHVVSAQSVVNELGRSGTHHALLRSVLTAEKFRSILERD